MTGVDPKGKSISEWVREILENAHSEPPNSPLANDIRDIVLAVEGWRKAAALTPLKGAPPTHRHLKSGHLVRVIGEAATELVNFAWSTVVTDCTESAEYLNELVDNLRVALASLPLLPPGEEEPGLTSHEAIKSLIGMVRAEAASWREPANCDPNNIRTLLDFIAATQEENRRLVKALDERDVLLESAEKQIVSLYRAAAPGGNYDNELTINGHVSGNNFADSDEVVIAIRGSRRATPDHGAAG